VGKSKQTKKGSSSPLRPLQRLTSATKVNKERPTDRTKPTSLSQKMGQVTGKMVGAKNQFRANIDHRKEQLHDLPSTAQYAVMQGKEQLTKPARDFKEGMKQAKEKRQKTDADRHAKHRQEQLHELPSTAQYAVMKEKEQLTKPARDCKEGMKQAKEKRQKTDADRQAKHRQTIADRRQALDEKRTPSRKTASYERPVT